MQSFWKAIQQHVSEAKIQSYPLTCSSTANNNHSPGSKLKSGQNLCKEMLVYSNQIVSQSKCPTMDMQRNKLLYNLDRILSKLLKIVPMVTRNNTGNTYYIMSRNMKITYHCKYTHLSKSYADAWKQKEQLLMW